MSDRLYFLIYLHLIELDIVSQKVENEFGHEQIKHMFSNSRVLQFINFETVFYIHTNMVMAHFET